MSVVKGKIIFCEGKKSSLDFSLLNRLFESFPSNKPTIVPAGSKFTFSVFAQGYFSPDEVGSQQYIVFRDRDFDVYPTENIRLLKPIKSQDKVFATHRACVENYLLDPHLIDNYWLSKFTEKQDNPSSKWGHGNSPGVETIKNWIENSARHLQEYQAVRWALGDLLQMSGSRVQLTTTWTGGSGKIPVSLELQDCKSQAQDLINQFIQGVKAVNQEDFEESLAKYQRQFTQVDFWHNQDYLIWFHGKDIQKMMQKNESNYISLNTFFDWAIAHLDIAQYPDLVELHTQIQQL